MQPTEKPSNLVLDDEYHERLGRVRGIANEQGLDGLIVCSAYMDKQGNVMYLTNHRTVLPPWAFDETRRGVGYCACILTSTGGVVLAAGPTHEQAMLADTVSMVIGGLNLSTAIVEGVKELGLEGARLGIAGSDVLPLAIYQDLAARLPRARFIACDGIIESLRAIKSPAEIAILSDGAAVADRGLNAAFEATRPGITENDIGLAAHSACLSAGADHVVRIRVRSGVDIFRRGRWPLATGKTVNTGEMIYMDLVGWYQGYVFDVSRCWVVGAATPEQRDLLDAGAELTETLASHLKPGLPADSAVAKTRDHFAGHRYAEFVRFMGHGVGLETVENPWIIEENPSTIESGMVCCLEPAFAVPDIGLAMIEDMFVIEPEGARVLNGYTRVLW